MIHYYKDIRYPRKGESNLFKLKKYTRTLEDWQKRRKIVRQNILQEALLDPFPRRTPLNPIIHSQRIYSGYSVANIFFESISGFFVPGNLYYPHPYNSSIHHPIFMIPHGHFALGRFEPDCQQLAATLARMGLVTMTYDMVGWPGSDSTQVDHNTPHALTFQLWNSIRGLDFLLGLEGIDPTRVGITGASGGGTQSFLLTAVDSRITLSIPVVMVSSRFYGGCNCESGLLIHRSPGFATNNAEIVALAAPRPQLLVSIDADWTWNTPHREYPYLKRIYRLYDAEKKIFNVHLVHEKHNYGFTKRQPVYRFITQQFHLHLSNFLDNTGLVDEKLTVIEDRDQMRAFNKEYPRPESTLSSDDSILQAIHL